MSRIYKTGPEFTFHCQCYHYETHYEHYTDSDGNDQTREVTRRVDTYSETKRMPYCSTRDVSGLFLLDIDKANIKKKYFIKIHLIKDIKFADAISYSDYLNFKKKFYYSNKRRDKYMDFTEKWDIPGFHAHELVLIRESEPPCVNIVLYSLLIFLTLSQFYKSYINSFCIRQTYKIRKLVSTRYNLLAPAYQQIYVQMTPAINILEQTYSFTTEDTGCSYSSDNLPTEEELIHDVYEVAHFCTSVLKKEKSSFYAQRILFIKSTKYAYE